jgi:hypothetical protein
MTTLVKYVLVTQSGDWLDMGTRAQIEELLPRWPLCHMERWTYRELPDGTHDSPSKELVSV